MDQNSLLAFISKHDPEAVTKEGGQFAEATITGARLHALASELISNSETQFDFLFNQTGIDIKDQLGVIYHLRSTKLNHTVVLKVFTSDRQNPQIDSVSDIWAAAEFMEREIFDLLGIRFNNHPDLRRLFLEDDFNGYPLRKDFVDPINIIHN